MQTPEQWTYGAILAFWAHWRVARETTIRRRLPRSGAGLLAFAAIVPTTQAARRPERCP